MAEDNDVNAFIADALLRNNGVEVVRATSGVEAVKAAMDKQRPHLVLMDLQMPDLDGLEVTVEIRRQEKAARISQAPIVAMTANSSCEDMADVRGGRPDRFPEQALQRRRARARPGRPPRAGNSDPRRRERRPRQRWLRGSAAASR